MSDRTKESMRDALMSNMPEEKTEIVPVENTVKPSQDRVIEESEEDVEFTRKHIKHLIETSSSAIETMLALAEDAEHPRAYEVLAQMIKSNADMSSQLIEVHKDRKKLLENADLGQTSNGNSTTNNIYVGTTDDLQKILNKRDADKEAIDV